MPKYTQISTDAYAYMYTQPQIHNWKEDKNHIHQNISNG